MRRETFHVYRIEGAAAHDVGSVEADDAAQAVFRLCGGEWGRTDYAAHVGRVPQHTACSGHVWGGDGMGGGACELCGAPEPAR